MKTVKHLLFIIAFLIIGTVNAQPPTFETDVEDAPAAALPGIAFAVVAALAIGFKSVQKEK